MKSKSYCYSRDRRILVSLPFQQLLRSGKVEFLGPLLGKIQRPDRTDGISFCLRFAINAVAKEGFEFASMTSDEIVMKRRILK